MHAAADRLEFAPPATPGLLRSVALAVLAHTLLVAALTWGVRWKHDDRVVAVEAELWASVPVQAAPPLVEEPPPPLVAPVPVPVKAAPLVSNADIALEREKELKAKEKLLKEKLDKEQRDKDKLALEKKAADEKKQKELTAQKAEQLKAQQETKLAEKRRQENIQRMTGLAGASGGPSAIGTALKSAGPSASYTGRIVARIKPNIVFTEELVGNPIADVEVRTSPDGTIVGRKLLKSSGNKAWDEAVLKAIDKTEVLPRDIDGQVPTPLTIGFRPRD
jgi:colicin import membrane protein